MIIRTFAAMAVAAAVAGTLVVGLAVAGQAPNRSSPPNEAAKTSWGEPDLQGLWSDEFQTPLQRPAKYAGREFFTDAEIFELDKLRSAIHGNETPSVRGAELDVAARTTPCFSAGGTRAVVLR